MNRVRFKTTIKLNFGYDERLPKHSFGGCAMHAPKEERKKEKAKNGKSQAKKVTARERGAKSDPQKPGFFCCF